MFCMLQCAACWNYRPGRGFLNVVQLQHHHHYTVGWSDLALFAIFKNGPIHYIFISSFPIKLQSFLKYCKYLSFTSKNNRQLETLSFS